MLRRIAISARSCSSSPNPCARTNSGFNGGGPLPSGIKTSTLFESTLTTSQRNLKRNDRPIVPFGLALSGSLGLYAHNGVSVFIRSLSFPLSCPIHLEQSLGALPSRGCTQQLALLCSVRPLNPTPYAIYESKLNPNQSISDWGLLDSLSLHCPSLSVQYPPVTSPKKGAGVRLLTSPPPLTYFAGVSGILTLASSMILRQYATSPPCAIARRSASSMTRTL